MQGPAGFQKDWFSVRGFQVVTDVGNKKILTNCCPNFVLVFEITLNALGKILSCNPASLAGNISFNFGPSLA